MTTLHAMVAALAVQAGPASPPAAEIFPPFIPLRAPDFASQCANGKEGTLGERTRSFCAGYARAVLENDPRLDDCHPILANVLEEIIARQRVAEQADDRVLARDFVVEVARGLCSRGQD